MTIFFADKSATTKTTFVVVVVVGVGGLIIHARSFGNDHKRKRARQQYVRGTCIFLEY